MTRLGHRLVLPCPTQRLRTSLELVKRVKILINLFSHFPVPSPISSGADSQHHQPVNMTQPKRKRSNDEPDASILSNEGIKRPKVSLHGSTRVGTTGLTTSGQFGMIPLTFSNQNEMFKEIQRQFISNQQVVAFCGEYTLPDAALSSLNKEAFQARRQSDRTIIRSLTERLWRMTGYRWKYVFSFSDVTPLIGPQSQRSHGNKECQP
jgi:hypothetical protein